MLAVVSLPDLVGHCLDRNGHFFISIKIYELNDGHSTFSEFFLFKKLFSAAAVYESLVQTYWPEWETDSSYEHLMVSEREVWPFLPI